MARLARLVIPGIPYHVTQRGNGGQRVFFTAADYAAYFDSSRTRPPRPASRCGRGV
jgi:hypothetical protein